MNPVPSFTCTAFEGSRRIASGELAQVAAAVKEVLDRGTSEAVLIFDDQTSEPVEIDFRGTRDEVLQRLATPAAEPLGCEASPSGPRGRGRPKLGVVAHEVTLLPRHWEWLNRQPGGASVTLRKLVEEAKRAGASKEQVRQSQEATYRFLVAMAGDSVGFEEATRALFAANRRGFETLVDAWPADLAAHAKRLAAAALEGPTAV